MDPLTVMWISLAGIGLMAGSAVLITFARLKTKGLVRMMLTLIAFGFLMTGFLLGVFAIIV